MKAIIGLAITFVAIVVIIDIAALKISSKADDIMENLEEDK